VTSQVDFYATLSGEIIEGGFPVNVTTACAPCAMNLHSPDIPVYFSESEQKAGFPKYHNKMVEIYEHILQEQIKAGSEILLIPPIGMGKKHFQT